MNQKLPYSKAFATILAASLLASGCAKQRPAALPEDARESIFAISEFGEIDTESARLSITTENQTSELSLGEASKAMAEKGIVPVNEVRVPARLQFMFRGLEIPGQPGHTYAITFAVDKEYITAYKVVTDTTELSVVEKQISMAKEEIVLQKQIQKAKENVKVRSLLGKLKEVRSKKTQELTTAGVKVLVPIFKYKIKSYGVLKRTKNELKEETSTLSMKSTDWSDATHIEIEPQTSNRMLVGADLDSKGQLDRTFVASTLNNKMMTAATLRDEFSIPLNLNNDARVLTLLDVDSMHIFEIGQIGKIEMTEGQVQQLKMGSNSSHVKYCPEDVKNSLPADAQENCAMILRYDVPVEYVSPELSAVDAYGNQDSKINLKKVRSADNVGLIKIEENVQPKKVESNNEMDPRTSILVSDIRGKEFFFKRTLQDAPVTTPFAPGMAGKLTIVKFELQENRLVIKKADKLVNFKSGSNDTDFEEIMTLPARYFKFEKKDSSGNSYSMAKAISATPKDADFVDVDWTKNSLASSYSPYSTLQDSCFESIDNSEVSDVDMRLDKGVLNFTFNYSASLKDLCIQEYNFDDSYNGNPTYQPTARLKERVSFKLNDGTTDKSFVPSIPFRVQNELGYGVWTLSRIAPTAEGLHGREGQEINQSVVQDFRDGKILTYTVTGLEPSANIDPELRQLYRDTATEVVEAWNIAYKQIFKGTEQERSGRYVDIQFAGDPGVSATIGDLDKNILHFENKFNDNHGVLGVSQVGFNPRSGIVVADSLIIYAGNLQQFVANTLRSLRSAHAWADMKKNFKESALADLKTRQLGTSPQAGNNSKSTANLEKFLAKIKFSDKPSSFAKLEKFISTKNTFKKNSLTPTRTDVVGFKYNSPKGNKGWMESAIRKIANNRQLDDVELEGVVASEILADKTANLRENEKGQLRQSVRRGLFRAKLNERFKAAPGCLLTERESITRNFAAKTFKDALKEELYFDIGHEMGHSQGLTHNFIGSFDKVNFNNEDGTPSKRNYSSIMDYYDAGQLNWDGIGTYDIHALRASHLGLLEASPAAIEEARKNGKMNELTNGKFITIASIKEKAAKSGWNNFARSSMPKVLRPYLYCTDIHIEIEPTCQRFDFGTSATDIVDSIIQTYEQQYITAYHGWDRNRFGWNALSAAHARTTGMMLNMRQFLDELFYKARTRQLTEEEFNDFANASLKAMSFYTQILLTADTPYLFESKDRFLTIPYAYQPKTDANGKASGQKLQDVAIVETRALTDLWVKEGRLDTIGLEFDKILALNLLTMTGFPAAKYVNSNTVISYLDFESQLMGLSVEQSLLMNNLKDLLLNSVQARFSNENVSFQPVPGRNIAITPAMRNYAGIFSILGLEVQTVNSTDNFANHFKVGRSPGIAPADRPSLSLLGAPETSATKIKFWPMDNAVFSQQLFEIAGSKYKYLKLGASLEPSFELLFKAQLENILSDGKKVSEISAAKENLLKTLTLVNKDGVIVSDAQLKENPDLSLSNQVDLLADFSNSAIAIAMSVVMQVPNADLAAQNFAQTATQLAQENALFSLEQKYLLNSMNNFAKLDNIGPEKEVVSNIPLVLKDLINGLELDNSYGIIMKNIEFLSNLTAMTNPEYAH